MAHPFQQNPQQLPHYPYHPGFPTLPLPQQYLGTPLTSQNAGPGQFQHHPPGEHLPSLQPQSSIQILSQELAAAHKRVWQYTDLISSLYAELETIRNIVCHNCRERISPANLASQSQVPIVESHGNLGDSPTISLQTAAEPPAAIPLPSTDDLNFLSPQANLPGAQLSLPLPTAVSQSSVISNGPVPTETSLPSPETPLAESDLAETESTESIADSTHEEPHWSVVYNNEIDQVLDVTFVHAFKHTAEVRAVRFSPDGNSLAAGITGKFGRIQIYDVKTRLMKCALQEYSGYSYRNETPLRSITSICYSPDGRFLVIADFHQIQIWEIATKRVLASFKESVWFADITPDGRLLVTSSSGDGSISLRKVHDGSSKLLMENSDWLKMVKFSPHGRYVAASILGDGFVQIWDVRSRKVVGRWSCHEGGIRGIAFSPDGERLMTGGKDGSMKSWNIKSLNESSRSSLSTEEEKGMLVAEEEMRFEGHSKDVRYVAVSPNGKWVMTGSADKLVCIWDMKTAVRQCTLEGHVGDVRQVDFSPVGNYIATGSQDGLVSLWTYQT